MILSLFRPARKKSAEPWPKLLKNFTAFIRKIFHQKIILQAYKDRAQNYER